MCLFIETIRIQQGEACNLRCHNERLNNTRSHFWPGCGKMELEEYLKLTPEMDGMKCRVVYDGTGIKEVNYAAYEMSPVRSLQLVCSDDIDYTYKSVDRSKLNRLFSCRGERDDVLIVRRGLLTDTSIANIALFDGEDWLTPRSPLLKGTCRSALLERGVIKEKEIRLEELSSYSSIRLFNAMIGWGQLELSVQMIHR
ncbi:MAG: aminotransferase class IV family protein [Phocaeicola sp.]|uniref:aminotransferase class IV family protein n=1 Tax=Phocaeicola sp. TaxID=2773926 RepID=UPI0023C419BE|nr:aminotransferase class IV family protein [Phocaeicola sp.]MDE5677050.1 aminotransferase class IV family protein [Phocaeicola sp.]MDE6181358.1 aminotransferase class IV family protein [Phocaeicola sp.]